MSSLERSRPSPSQEPPSPGVEDAGLEGATSNSAQAAQLGLGGGSEPRGGGKHTVLAGQSLWKIAEKVYGAGHYWTQLAAANPDQVFKGGELILVGAVLELPRIEVPVAADSSAQAPAGEDTAPPSVEQRAPESSAPLVPATQPRGVCTEYGDFIIYPDAFVGPLPVDDPDNKHLRESDYRTYMDEQAAADLAESQAVGAEVQDLLSTGWTDWAVTDADATRAMEAIAALPLFQARQAVRSVSNIDKLLDNLPGSARSRPEYARLLMALGPQYLMPELASLAEGGLLDAIFNPGEADQALEILALVSAQQRSALLSSLEPEQQRSMLSRLGEKGGALSEAEQAVVDTIFSEASDLDLLKAAFSARFGLDVDVEDGPDWDVDGLRRTYAVLLTLPPGHIEDNDALDAWVRDGDDSSSTGGWYRGSEDKVGVNYDTSTIETAINRSESDEDQDGTDETTDPLHGVNRFDKVIRHEVGHAVDDAIGGADRYCIGQARGGNWQEHGDDTEGVIGQMVAASGGAISNLSDGDRDALISAMADKPEDALAQVQATSEYQTLSADEKAAVDADVVINAVQEAVDNPWYRHAGGVSLGGRHYVRSYGSKWNSYEASARSRKVSEYQFRAPGEWFAEAYSAYYQPNADGSCDHHFLSGVDPTTKRWFDANVDTAGA